MASPIQDHALIYTLSTSKIGTRKKVDSSRVSIKNTDQQPDADAIGVSKKILDCPEYDAIATADNDISQFLRRRALTCSMFKRGVYLVPIQALQAIDDRVERFKSERANELVPAFLAVYDQAREHARDTLGPLFDVADYPSIDQVRAAFRSESRYMELGTPGTLRHINPDVFEREQAAFRDRLESAADEIQTALRDSFADLVGHMAERLGKTETGKPRIFRDTLVSNLREFLDSFDSRNIADDDQLSALVQQARDSLGNRTPDQLRRVPAARDAARAAMEDIKARLDTMTMDKPGRKFDFDESD